MTGAGIPGDSPATRGLQASLRSGIQPLLPANYAGNGCPQVKSAKPEIDYGGNELPGRMQVQ